MIDESAGATPFGIFSLADHYLQAAQLCSQVALGREYGPMRLLAYHAAELFMKANLRSNGWLIADLRGLQHDLPRMAAACCEYGLTWDKNTARDLTRIQEANDYVRVRYVVSDSHPAVRQGGVLKLLQSLRETVRLNLNMDEFGTPLGLMWAAGRPPADYPDVEGMASRLQAQRSAAMATPSNKR
jgi:hypothetical protein